MILLETYTDFDKEHKWALESISTTKTFCTLGHLRGLYTNTQYGRKPRNCSELKVSDIKSTKEALKSCLAGQLHFFFFFHTGHCKLPLPEPFFFLSRSQMTLVE